MKTTLAKNESVQRDWKIVDASGKILGRLAVDIANALRGRTKPTYTPHVDTGDYVIVINSDKIKLTGSKEEQKKYMFYSGYMGNEKYRSVADFRETAQNSLLLMLLRACYQKINFPVACSRVCVFTEVRTMITKRSNPLPSFHNFSNDECQSKNRRIHRNRAQKNKHCARSNPPRFRNFHDQ